MPCFAAPQSEGFQDMRPTLTRVLRKTSLRLGFERDWYLYIVAAVIGLVMAVVATAFIAPLRAMEDWGDSMGGNPLLPWLILIGPALGGLAVGVLRHFIRARDVGPGVTTLMYAVLRQRSRIPARVGLQKWLCSTATIATGGSAGAEGLFALERYKKEMTHQSLCHDRAIWPLA